MEGYNNNYNNNGAVSQLPPVKLNSNIAFLHSQGCKLRRLTCTSVVGTIAKKTC